MEAKGESLETMKVLIWNCNGFGKAKLLLHETLFNKYDVIILTEAKRDNELLTLKAFTKYHFARSAGVKGGGLTIFVRTTWPEIQVQKLWNGSAMMGTNCTVGHENTTGKMLNILASYYPPERTQCKVSKSERRDFEKGLTKTIVEAELAEELFLLCGDTNARVGNENDGKIVDMFRFNKEEWKLKPRKKNQDQVINSNGEFLLRCCRQTQVWLLNGRCIPNEWTYSIACKGRKQGRKDFTKKSNCDTFCGHEEVIDACKGDILPMVGSDHSAIVLEIKVRRGMKTCADTDLREKALLRKKTAWSMDKVKIDEFRKALTLNFRRGLFYDESDKIKGASKAMATATNGRQAQDAVDQWLKAIEADTPFIEFVTKGELAEQQIHSHNRTDLKQSDKSAMLQEGTRKYRAEVRKWHAARDHQMEGEIVAERFDNMLKAKSKLDQLNK